MPLPLTASRVPPPSLLTVVSPRAPLFSQCYSHVHCCRLLSESLNPIEIIVWRDAKRNGPRVVGTDDELLEIS